VTIKVNYAALEHAMGQIRAISGQMDEKLNTLRSSLQRMQWDGQDRESYNVHQKKWDDAVADLNRVLAQIGQAVGAARENYMSTEMRNSKLWS
jgi:WXG100 family type VII secretion target